MKAFLFVPQLLGIREHAQHPREQVPGDAQAVVSSGQLPGQEREQETNLRRGKGTVVLNHHLEQHLYIHISFYHYDQPS